MSRVGAGHARAPEPTLKLGAGRLNTGARKAAALVTAAGVWGQRLSITPVARRSGLLGSAQVGPGDSLAGRVEARRPNEPQELLTT